MSSKDPAVTVNALNKLVYLHMLGCDISPFSFKCVEIMSYPSFKHKRVGFLVASLLFKPDNEVLLLTPNLYKKMLTVSDIILCT
jgi:AP-3 complex subunit delta-1